MSSLNVRWYASNTIQPAITHSAMVLSIAASTSERWYPNVRSADAAFSANRMAMRAIRIARASVSMCPASAMRARLPDKMPPTTSANM